MCKLLKMSDNPETPEKSTDEQIPGHSKMTTEQINNSPEDQEQEKEEKPEEKPAPSRKKTKYFPDRKPQDTHPGRHVTLTAEKIKEIQEIYERIRGEAERRSGLSQNKVREPSESRASTSKCGGKDGGRTPDIKCEVKISASGTKGTQQQASTSPQSQFQVGTSTAEQQTDTSEVIAEMTDQSGTQERLKQDPQALRGILNKRPEARRNPLKTPRRDVNRPSTSNAQQKRRVSFNDSIIIQVISGFDINRRGSRTRSCTQEDEDHEAEEETSQVYLGDEP